MRVEKLEEGLVNWNEESLKEWLTLTTRKGTKPTYKSTYSDDEAGR